MKESSVAMKAAREAPTTNVYLAPVRPKQKIGRNDPCPCNSGKKFKHCHWRRVIVATVKKSSPKLGEL